MKKGLIVLVKFYQICLSPFFVSRCRYTPTCSMYTIECLEKHGALKGFGLVLKEYASVAQAPPAALTQYHNINLRTVWTLNV